jgi:hypothetical protein
MKERLMAIWMNSEQCSYKRLWALQLDKLHWFATFR